MSPAPLSGAPRVAVVADVLQSSGGLEIFEHRIGRTLAARGWDVTVIHRAGGDLAPAWSIFATMCPVAGAPPADVVEQADVVYVHTPALFADAVHAARVAARPVVAHLHLPPEHLRTGWRALVKGRTRWPMPPEVFTRDSEVSEFIAVSRHTAQEWIRSGLPAGRVHVVHNGVDPAEFRPADPDEREAVRGELGIGADDLVVGFVGRIDPRKGIAELLAAVQSIRRHRGDVRLVVVGETTRFLQEAGDTFEQRVRSLADDSVLWLGKRTDAARLYRAMDLCVVPSRWAEPFGLVVVEAMASGVPVVAARRGGIPEILTGDLATWLCRPTARSLARAIGPRLDRTLLDGEGQRARAHVVEHFTLDITVDGVERALRRAMASHPHSPTHEGRTP